MPAEPSPLAVNVEMMRRLACGDRDALSEVYDATATLLFSLSFRILGNTQEVEEVVQEVFVQIWIKAALYDAELGNPVHWIIGIARNRSIDRLRARQRQARMLDQALEFAGVDTVTGNTVDNPQLGDDELAAIRTAVESLPSDQRSAVELAFFSGLSHSEIAQRTGAPLGTVKARIRRGMLKLREDLQDYA